MKILIVSDVYPPEPRGGARHTQHLAEHLSRRGHQVSVCTTAFPGFPGVIEEGGLRVYRVHGLFYRIPFFYPPPLGDKGFETSNNRFILDASRMQYPRLLQSLGK